MNNRICNLRKENGWTQDDLADKIDMSKASISSYENGTKKPSLDVLVKLSEVFDCSIDYLLGRSDVRKPNA